MSMYGAQALEYEEMASSRPARRVELQPSFEVVTGGGLDARVRAGVSPEFLARVKAVVAATVLFFVLGTMRVALTSMTVAQLSTNAHLREEISDYTTSNDNLRVERSLMASASRIDRIATQNYGMVAPASFDVIVIDDGVEDEEALAEEAAADEEIAEEDVAAEENLADAPADEEIAEEALAQEGVSAEEADGFAEVEDEGFEEPEAADGSSSFDATQLAAGL